MAAAAAANAKVIVGDNLYMYGDTDGQPIREDLPDNAHTRKGKTRAQMAQAVLAAHKAGTVRAAIARGADFYGPMVLGSTLGERVFGPLLAGKPAQLLGDVDLPHTYTVIDDFGRALALLGAHNQALGQVWHVPNPPTRSQRELLALAAQIAGVEPKFSSMGRLMMRIGGLFVPEARETVEMMYEFEKPFVVDHTKFMQAFGPSFGAPTPHEDALRATIDWYRAHHP
jgi:nucleoside-diphosphate-sugar epimerase